MSIELTNRVALVTGANRGIGKAILTDFLKKGAKKVYAGVRSLEKGVSLVAELGERVTPLVIDYNSPDTIQAAAVEAADVEIVVSNAGILEPCTVFDDNVIATFERELQVNVYGLLRMAKAFAPVLKANGGGAFVQLNSIASLANFPGFSTYCASKAAAYSFTQALKASFAEQGTQLLSVHPGPIATDMAAEAGMGDIGDPAERVSEGIVTALRSGDFHLFPDTMAKSFEKAYHSFAAGVIEAEPFE